MKQGDKNSLPNGWEMKKLGEVCDFKSGNTINSKLEKSEGEIIYAKVGDMNLEGNEEYITISSRYVDKNEIKENQIIVAGSIIFPKRGGAIATNKKRRILKPTIIDLNTMALVPTKIINQDYLYYWFLQIDLSKLSNGTSIPQINNYSFDEVYISYPLSFEEQQSIVAKLDEAFEAIEKAKANAEQNLKNAKELFDSYLQAIFENKGKDWKEVPLADLATFRNGMNFTKSSNGEVIKIVGVRDFQNSFWVPFENLDSVIIDGELNDIDLLREDDILAVRSNGNPELIGRTLLAGKFEGKISHSGFTIRIRLNCKNVLPVYLCIYLKTQKVRKELINRGNGVGIKSLNQGSLASLLIHLPPVSEQQSIVQKLDALSSETKKLEANYQKKLEDLEELKKSILQKAFSGQL